MASLRSCVESWIRDQTVRVGAAWPPQPPRWRWPPWKGREGRKEQERRIREEYERQRRQLNDLCATVKVESVADLQDVLISMVLSECVYKRPATEMVRFINKFKSDFGGQIVSLERVQPSLDHVPHRYLLAEAGDTLFASFIGTKQYKDIIADANIFQGAIFHEDNEEDLEMITSIENNQEENQKKSKDKLGRPLQTKPQLKKNARPAAHRGFLARAKGIPALELYRLALRKKRKLVLCGHSLGGAVAALATLAILRVLASTSTSKEHDKIQVKCITFSQPPVGNAALKDYVYQKGWEHHFKSYCIPEDLVPRILSPAYFHHYNAQTPQASPSSGTSRPIIKPEESKKASRSKSKGNDREQLVLGVGPIQTSFWRLSKLVPLEGVRKQLSIFRRVGNEVREASSFAEQGIPLTVNEDEAEPQSLEIQEGSDGISLTPLLEKYREPIEGNDSQLNGKNSVRVGDSRQWRRVPYLPSYVPFGQLYLLGNSSVESLSDAEYSKLISVRSVIAELRERFQSHSMKSYRSRFQKIYDQCMCMNASPFMGLEQLPQFPHLQKWLGLAAVGSVELGHIVDPPVIRTATSIIPLGWSGVPGDRSAEPLKVDIVGHGLHLCTLVQAQINGNWCSTAVESLPSMPPCPSEHNLQPDLQKMRILIGSPLKRPPKHPVLEDSLLPTYSSPVTGCGNSSLEYNIESFSDEKSECSEDLNGFIIYCTSDFITVMKKVYVRTRKVRLLGFEGSGKTSLFKAILDRGKRRNNVDLDSILPDVDCKEAVGGGICYLDSAGVNLQELHSEASRFRKELQMGVHDLSKKTDLVVLVHNLSQKIPRYHQSNTPQSIPALSLLLNEATALGIPWVFAITNKFSVSADQQRMLVKYAMESYQASPSTTEVINSCPFIMPSAARSSPSLSSADDMSSKKEPAHRIISASLNFARIPFQKRPMIFPVEGVTAFRHLVHHVLQSHEEMAFQELASERLSVEIAREQEMALDARQEAQGKGGSITAAAVGASLGAGLGLVMAVVMGAASALRKP